MDIDLRKHIPDFRSANFWLTTKGIIGAAIIGFLIASALIKLGCIPTKSVQPGETNIQLWNIITIVGSVVITVIIWFIWRLAYLKTGKGLKIGVAYDSFAISHKEWNRTRETLKHLFKRNEINKSVSLP